MGYETVINAQLESEGYNIPARVITLDAKTGESSDLNLSLGCILGTQIAYITPYSLEVPPSTNAYVVAIWNEITDEIVEDNLAIYYDFVLTDDGSALFISHRLQLNNILRMMEKVDQNRGSELELFINTRNSENDDVEKLWGDFDTTGLRDALAYLPCF